MQRLLSLDAMKYANIFTTTSNDVFSNLFTMYKNRETIRRIAHQVKERIPHLNPQRRLRRRIKNHDNQASQATYKVNGGS